MSAITAQRADDRPERRVRDADLQVEINRTIERANGYLRQSQCDDGHWEYDFDYGTRPARVDAENVDYSAGLTALALYALASSDSSSGLEIQRGLEWCRENRKSFLDGKRAVYSASLLVLALTRIDAKRYRRWIHSLSRRLVDAQLDNGMWSYTRRGRRRGSSPSWLLDGDNSNTQFAVLALWAAQSAARYRVPSSVWRKVRSHFEKSQLSDGGWSYKRPVATRSGKAPLWMYQSKPSMTAAGLVSYTCALAAMNGGTRSLKRARKSKVSKRGLQAFRADMDDWDAMFWDYYYAYSVERVGTVLGLESSTWYGRGAKLLTTRQRSDGQWALSWRGGRPRGMHGDSKHVYQTAMALLFLSKATAQPITPRKR